MKKITEIPGLENVKQRRGLKLTSALSIALPMFGNTVAYAQKANYHVYQSDAAVAKTTGVTLGPKTTGWFRVYWTAAQAGYNGSYTEHNSFTGEHDIRYYCLEPSVISPDSGTTGRESDTLFAKYKSQLSRVLMAGYGINSAKDLGVSNWQAAELATQLVVWETVGYRVDVYNAETKKAYNHIHAELNAGKYKGSGTTDINFKTVKKFDNKTGEATVQIKGTEMYHKLNDVARLKDGVEVTVSGGLTAIQGSKKITSKGKLDPYKNITLKAAKGETKVEKDVPYSGTDAKYKGKRGTKTTYTWKKGTLKVTELKVSPYGVVYKNDKNGVHHQTSFGLVGMAKTHGSWPYSVSGSYWNWKPNAEKGGDGSTTDTGEEGEVSYDSTPESSESTKKVKARILKKDDEGNPVEGVEFKVYESNENYEQGKEVATITTGKDGYAVTGDLAPGYYIARESKTHDDLKLDDSPVTMKLDVDQLAASDESDGVTKEESKDDKGNSVTTYTATFNGPTNNHKDLEVSSKATSDEDGGKTLQPIEGEVTLNEKLMFHYMRPGQEYKVKVWLVDKKNGTKILSGGKEVATEETIKGPDVDSNFNSSKDFKIKVPDASVLADKEIVAYARVTKVSNNKETAHTDINDAEETVKFTKPVLHTNASDQSDKDKTFVADKDQKLNDKITYSGLIKGKQYTVTGTLMDKNTKKPIQVNGKDVTFTKTFTAENESGTIDNEVTFDASNLSGANIVVFEQLHYNGKKLADHADINDKDQSVTVAKPKARVEIVKKDDEGNNVEGVKFKIYKADANYKQGEEVETVVTDKNGVAKSSALPLGYYVAVESETVKNLIIDTTPVKIDLNEPVLRNMKAKYTVKGNDMVFLRSTDGPLNNHKQPELSSKATNFEDGTQTLQPIQGPVVVNEHLFFNHLIAKTDYTVNAWLVDKSTGEPILIDGKKVEVSKTITSGDDDSYDDGIRGEADLQLEISDASSLVGKDIVVFSTIARTSKPNHYTTLHQDINDEAETVHFTTPGIHTNATNGEIGGEKIQPTNKEIVDDKISYTGLIPGKTYTVTGTIVDKATGKSLQENGKDVTFTKTFTAEKASGYVHTGTAIDATKLAGHKLVVFETLYYNDRVLVEHKNINDVDQTVIVTVPSLHTTLSDHAQKLVAPKENNTVEDVVSYKNLIKGQKYIISGRLVDQVTGKTITRNGKAVVASTEFTATGENGQVTVPFTFNGKNYVGHSLVAFEDLTYKGRDLAKHEDIKDTAQTVTVDHLKPTIIRTPTTTITTTLPQTGNSDNLLQQIIGAGIMVVTVGSAVYFVRRRQTTGLD